MKKYNPVFSILLIFVISITMIFIPKPIEAVEAERENNIAFAPAITKTAVAQDGEKRMVEFIQKLQKQRKLNSGAEKGRYKKLSDVEMIADRTNPYVWKSTGLSPKNFVLRMDIKWSRGGDKINSTSPVFAIIFHNTEDKYFYSMGMWLDGIVYFGRYNDSKPEKSRWTDLKHQKYGNLATEAGETHVDLVVNRGEIYVYLDNKFVASAYDPLMKSSALFEKGELGFNTYSDENADHRTQVKLSNIELWEIAED